VAIGTGSAPYFSAIDVPSRVAGISDAKGTPFF